MPYSITIDGPAGCGKSTLAKNLQKDLKGFVLVDTGAYYRWAARLCLDNRVDIQKSTDVYKLVKDKLDLKFVPYPRGHKYYSAKIYFNGELINKQLYTREVTESVPTVATYPKVREVVKKKLREMAKENNIIVAGRDIGTEVLPKAEVKIYLNPSAESRARRRFRDEVKQGKTISLTDLKNSMARRDDQDTKRKYGPLRQPDDALVIDNTYYTPTQTLKEVMKFILKEIPDAKDLEPLKTEIPVTDQTDYSWGETKSPSPEASQTTKDLKKRLKEKYKQMQSGGAAGFFSKY